LKFNFRARTWHTWTSLILALPLLIVVVTALSMAHKKALGTDGVPVAANWLPGYQTKGARMGNNEPRATLITASGDTYIGTLGGLYRLADTQLVAVEELVGTPVRGLAKARWGVVAATKNGIWLEQNGKWQRVLNGDASNAVSQPDGSVVVAIKDRWLVSSQDGLYWQTDERLVTALSSLPSGAEPITLSRLIMDIHTGKALFGKEGEWIWIDLIGLALSSLALTGLYMWWRNKRRKAAAIRAG